MDSKDEGIKKLLRNKEHIAVVNKIDIASGTLVDGIKISAKNKQIRSLIKAISDRLQFMNFDTSKQIVLQSTRAIGLMEQTIENLLAVRKLMMDKEPIDLSSEFLMNAHNSVISILGKEDDFNFINEIFRKFCVGK
ncbi:hypothetical protein FACS1894218_1900 [Bacilli bacterium]|nr:hypothetical protein FACS1894218_1900 [Bacilli bacterium]